jgi:hypothetical protein
MYSDGNKARSAHPHIAYCAVSGMAKLGRISLFRCDGGKAWSRRILPIPNIKAKVLGANQ